MSGKLAAAENKPPKIEIREKLVSYKICDNCPMENHKKAKIAYESLTFGYKAFFVFIAGYALYVTIFQLIRADVFIESCKHFFNVISGVIEYINPANFDVFESNILNICFKILFILCVIMLFIFISNLVVLFYKSKYIFHWGTAAELLFTLGLFVNLDEYFPQSWQGHLFTIFFVLHIVYLITICIVRFKIENN